MIKNRLKKFSYLSNSYINWWLNDLPPLHGVLRFIVYGVLLYLHPFYGLSRYVATDPELFVPYGLLHVLHIPYISPEYINILVKITQVAWLFAAIGLATRFSMIFTALGFAFVHGMFMGSNTLNHGWYLPMYALIALCFARTNDCWSLDYYLSKLWRKKGRVIPERNVTLADTGFARKLFLIITAGFYFASGAAKLLTSGSAWHDGHTLQYFSQIKLAKEMPLTPFLADNLWLCDISSSATLILELGVIAALFSSKARHIIILGLVLMHLGIYYTFKIPYFTNVVCLALLINWGGIVKTIEALINRFLKMFKLKLTLPRYQQSTYLKKPIDRLYQSANTLLGVVGGTILMFLMLTVAIWQIVWWPFTNVYMFSTYFSLPLDIRANYPRVDYYKPATAQNIAKELLDSNSHTRETAEYFFNRIALRLTGENKKPMYLYNDLGVYNWKQYVLTLVRPVLIEDFATKPLGHIEFDPAHPEYPAQKFLSDYVSVLKKYIPEEIKQKYQYVELVYPLMDSSVQVSEAETALQYTQLEYPNIQKLELVNLPELKFIPIASVSIKAINP